METLHENIRLDEEIELDESIISTIKILIKPMIKPEPVQKPYSINKIRNYEDLARLHSTKILQPKFWSNFPTWLNPEDIEKLTHSFKTQKQKLSIPMHNTTKQIEEFDLSICIENLYEIKELKQLERFLRNQTDGLIKNITNNLKQYQKQLINYIEKYYTPYASIEELINHRNNFTNKYFEYEGYLHWMNIYNSFDVCMNEKQKNIIIQDHLQNYRHNLSCYTEYEYRNKEYAQKEIAMEKPIFYNGKSYYIENDIMGIAHGKDGTINYGSYILFDDDYTDEKHIKAYKTNDKIIVLITIENYHISRPAKLILSNSIFKHKKI